MTLKHNKHFLGDEQPIILNIPQALAIMAPQPNVTLEWGRGTGKSTILSYRAKELSFSMPRGAFALVGETYSQILTRTLPATIAGLEMLGYYQNIHFFVGRTAPAKWKWLAPYQPPLNFDHAIHFISGACFNLISLDLANSGRGLNSDAAIGDEAALFDYDKLFNNVLTTIRGNIDRFGDCRLHQSRMFTSSTPMSNKGNWLLKEEEKAKKNPQQNFYLRASAEFNRHNLGDKFFTENKGVMTEMVYNAEILNIRPGKVEGGFYPLFDESKHTYNDFNNSFLQNLDWNFEKAKEAGSLADNDVQTNIPIDIALDYGGKINTIVAEQTFGSESRFLNAMFVKSPTLIDQLINNFCKYYQSHKNKQVIYWYDQTAIGKYGTSNLTFSDTVMNTFAKNGWKVIPRYMGAAPGHHDKYMFFSNFHKGEDPRLPKPKYNKTNCKYLIISIEKAGIKEGKNGFEKDKRPEHYSNAIDEETTHFSDAHDTVAYFKYSSRIAGIIGDITLP